MSMNPDKDVNSPNISQEARRIANAIGAFGDLGTADRLNLLAELMQMATTLADYELFAVCVGPCSRSLASASSGRMPPNLPGSRSRISTFCGVALCAAGQPRQARILKVQEDC